MFTTVDEFLNHREHILMFKKLTEQITIGILKEVRTRIGTNELILICDLGGGKLYEFPAKECVQCKCQADPLLKGVMENEAKRAEQKAAEKALQRRASRNSNKSKSNKG